MTLAWPGTSTLLWRVATAGRHLSAEEFQCLVNKQTKPGSYLSLRGYMACPLSEDVQSIQLYRPRHVVLHWYCAPFILLYGAWLYVWLGVYGLSDSFEAALISGVAIALTQVLVVLFCFWSVDVRCHATCSQVSTLQLYALAAGSFCPAWTTNCSSFLRIYFFQSSGCTRIVCNNLSTSLLFELLPGGFVSRQSTRGVKGITMKPTKRICVTLHLCPKE